MNENQLTEEQVKQLQYLILGYIGYMAKNQQQSQVVTVKDAAAAVAKIQQSQPEAIQQLMDQDLIQAGLQVVKEQEPDQIELLQDPTQLQALMTGEDSEEVAMSRNGSKLNYIRTLKGECPEGYELKFMKAGGRVCRVCQKKKQQAEKVDKAACGKKMKGISKAMEGIKIDLMKCGGKKIENKKCGGSAKKIKKGQNAPANTLTLDNAANAKTSSYPQYITDALYANDQRRINQLRGISPTAANALQKIYNAKQTYPDLKAIPLGTSIYDSQYYDVPNVTSEEITLPNGKMIQLQYSNRTEDAAPDSIYKFDGKPYNISPAKWNLLKQNSRRK